MGYQKTFNYLQENGLQNLTNAGENEFIMFRHGQTNYNLNKWICGSGGESFDVPLNNTGIQQALDKAADLKYLVHYTDKDIVVLSSPQPRAIETQELVTSQIEVGETIICPFLKEVDAGNCEGQPYGSVAPDEFVITQDGGISYDQYCREVYQGMSDVLEIYKGTLLLISTHGTTGSLINQMFGNNYKTLGNVELLEYDQLLRLKQSEFER